MPQHDPNQVAQRAYEIWEREGCPHGKQEEHWQRALAELESEATARADSSASAAPQAKPKAQTVKAEPAVKPEKVVQSPRVAAPEGKEATAKPSKAKEEPEKSPAKPKKEPVQPAAKPKASAETKKTVEKKKT